MSTCAYWRLWVGVNVSDIKWASVRRARAYKFIDQIEEQGFYEVAADLKIEYIYMHGREVGLGVEVAELDWATQIGRDNVFDTTKITKARSLVLKVKRVFSELGIQARVHIFHHIDLGG